MRTPTETALERERARKEGIVADVVAAEMRRSGMRGLVVASPPGPERSLLMEWLSRVGTVEEPDPRLSGELHRALRSAPGCSETFAATLAWSTAAQVRAGQNSLLPVGAENKTLLLLGAAPLSARVLPLGDIWASEIERLAGGATYPSACPARPEAEEVEQALEEYLSEGRPLADAFRRFGARRASELTAALEAGTARRSGLLVPKLEAWTVGVDLAR